MTPGDMHWLAAAAWAGTHALPVFAGLLALCLVAAWALGRVGCLLAQRSGRLAVAWRVGAGLAVVLVALGLFASLAVQISPDGLLHRTDQALTDAVRTGVGPTAWRTFGALTHLADPATLIGLGVAVALLLAGTGQWALAACWVWVTAGNGVLNPALKQVFGRIRPLPDAGMAPEPGLSFPSGHSSGALVCWGMLAWLAWQLLPPRWHLPALLAAVTVVFTVGASRVLLRVHYVSDVLAGFASGTAWLVSCITVFWLARHTLTQWSAQRRARPSSAV